MPVVASVYPRYDDVCNDIAAFVTDTGQAVMESSASRVWIDSGIGFGKSADHNIRVHDVPETIDTIAMLDAIWG